MFVRRVCKPQRCLLIRGRGVPAFFLELLELYPSCYFADMIGKKKESEDKDHKLRKGMREKDRRERLCLFS